MLAGIAISLASFISLSMPVLTTRITAGSIPFGFIEFYAVIVMALFGAIKLVIPPILGNVSFGRFPAIGTRELYVFIRSEARAVVTELEVAFRRAKAFAVFPFSVFVLFAALLACSYFRNSPSMGHAIRVGYGTSVRTIFTGAVFPIIKFYSGRGNKKSFSAGLAYQQDRHQKILPTKDVRLVILEWGRPAVGSWLFGTGSYSVPSPIGIIPQVG
jgi:hypothetical protein